MRVSIPSGLAINEQSRLLAYLKAKFQPGYFLKCDMRRLSRDYGKDVRTINNTLQTLKHDGLIGEDHKAIYLRSWKYITGQRGFNLQSFETSLGEIRDKEIFESMLFGAKVTSIQKAIRKGMAKVRSKGKRTNQIAIPTGFLAEACHTSVGKVNELKKKASSLGLVSISKSFEDHGVGTAHSVRIARRERPGLFLRSGRLTRRGSDQIMSNVPTYRIRNRKNKKP